MIAAQLLVPFVEAPRNREARDNGARKGNRLMRCQHGGADPITVQLGRSRRAVERQQLALPCPPALDIPAARPPEPLLGAPEGATGGPLRAAAEPKREQSASIVGRKIDFAAQGDIAVLGVPI